MTAFEICVFEAPRSTPDMASLESYGWPTRLGIVTSTGVWTTALLWLVQQSVWFSILFLGLCLGLQLVQNWMLADELSQLRRKLEPTAQKKGPKKRFFTVSSCASSGQCPRAASRPSCAGIAESETPSPMEISLSPKMRCEIGDADST